jgi:predicted pyridoxine 5'-phosphate oxidase superfamily flavin-nucleotide-binding protein
VGVVLDDVTRRLLDGKNFATVATVNPDGGPQASVVWILRDGDTVLFSAIATRRKAGHTAAGQRLLRLRPRTRPPTPPRPVPLAWQP